MTFDRALALSYLAGRVTGGDRPDAVGRKFDELGGVLPFPGNTFVCHIPEDAPVHRALTEAQCQLRAGPHADAFSFLPPSSFHMTLFEGFTESYVRTDGWPAGMTPGLSTHEVTEAILERIAQVTLPQEMTVRSTGIFGGFSVRLTGADDDQDRLLRAARETLSAATGIRRADFETYDFHITLAYPLRWLGPDDAEEVQTLADLLWAAMIAEVAQFAVGPVQFCTFEDMHAFVPLRSL